jgi:hypothetical protein
MFGIGASMKKSSRALLINEQSLFWRLCIHLSMCANPLTWWQTHEGQFPNVVLFTKQILRIPKSQIEIEIIFAWWCFDNFDVLLLPFEKFGLD